VRESERGLLGTAINQLNYNSREKDHTKKYLSVSSVKRYQSSRDSFVSRPRGSRWENYFFFRWIYQDQRLDMSAR